MTSIVFDEVTKSFGATPAIREFSATIGTGVFCVLIGPSGCGKSTLLRMINATIRPDRGRISIGGDDIAILDPVVLRRHIGYVIQSIGLFPHWTIAENISAVPRLLGWSRAQRARRVEEMAALLDIEPALLGRYPHQLSGGQQQRVGVARALAADPEIILMDEPFAALDPTSRVRLQGELRKIHAQSGKTIVFVTHDMEEALQLATRLLVMDKGRLVQAAAPIEILQNPANVFVAEFLGGDSRQARLLDQLAVRDRSRRRETGAKPAIAPDATLRQAFEAMLVHRVTSLAVVDEAGRRHGEIHIGDIIAGAGPGPDDESR